MKRALLTIFFTGFALLLNTGALEAAFVTLDFSSGTYARELGSATHLFDTYIQDGYKCQLRAGEYFQNYSGGYTWFTNGDPLVPDIMELIAGNGEAFNLHSIDYGLMYGTAILESDTGHSMNLDAVGDHFHPSTYQTINLDWNQVSIFRIYLFDPQDDFQANLGLDNLVLYANPVPLPGAVWLLGSGLIGIVYFKRRKKP